MDSPRKKRVSALVALMDMDYHRNAMDQGESSSDESFKIENHNESDDDDDSSGSDIDDSENDDEENSSEDDELAKKNNEADPDTKEPQPGTSKDAQKLSTQQLIDQSKAQTKEAPKIHAKPVCCACLGDRSDDSNEIVECDGCKVTVHEGCYGVSESISVSSTISSCSTEPWFCEACRANVKDPDCELCPNKGGIFKETDCGRWVHLVCALYVPGVAFGELDQLSIVTLFEMQYNKWGSKKCSLCDDDKFAWTGVCIGCDAGMCKTFFHVTCAQRAGFLLEARHEEVDPFFAHCKVHSDKNLVKNRKRNYNAFLMQTKRHEMEMAKNNEKLSPEEERIQRKLAKHRIKFANNKTIRPEPWVPTQKMPRKLATSASACRKLSKKAEVMGINTKALEFEETQIAPLHDIRKKWHVPPAFSTEFVAYYLDRTSRLQEMKENLQKQTELNQSLQAQQSLRSQYDDLAKEKEDILDKQRDLINQINFIHDAIHKIMPTKQLPSIEMIGRPIPPASNNLSTVKMISSPSSRQTASSTVCSTPPSHMPVTGRMAVPTAAAKKMGVGFPLSNLLKDETGRVLSTQRMNNNELMNECGICKKCTNQHLLVKCDNCHLYYHLGCLNPPLTRIPKKSKTYSWQCSECDKSDGSGSESMIIPKGPRKSRVRYSKDGPIYSDPLRSSFGSEKSSSMVSRKSEDSFRHLNGSETDLSIKLAPEPVPTTSTPLEAVTKMVKKRIRKIKPKKTEIQDQANESSSLNSPEPNHSEADPETAHSTQKDSDIAVSKAKKPRKKKFKQENSDIANHEITPNSEVCSIITPDQSVIGSSTLQPNEMAPKPRKGRPPKKPKPSITQITENLQIKQQHPVESAPDLLKEVDQIENGIPVLAGNTSNDKTSNTGDDNSVSQSSIIVNGTCDYVNGDSNSNLAHHKHKKRKSHKRRHSRSPSEGDHTPGSKKRKRKRKHKVEDSVDTESSSQPTQSDMNPDRSPEQPRIKMKIKKVVGNDANFMCSLPSPTESDKADSQTKTAKVTNSLEHATDLPITNGHTIQKTKKTKKNPEFKKPPVEKKNKKISQTKLNDLPGISTSLIEPPPVTSLTQPTVDTTTMNKSMPVMIQINCDVCELSGTKDNTVKCDECKKNYHFHCLSPPVKKTPKKRGYSWTCSDCFSDSEIDSLIRKQNAMCSQE